MSAPDFRHLTGIEHGLWPTTGEVRKLFFLSATRVPLELWNDETGENVVAIIQAQRGGVLQILIPSGSTIEVDVISQDEYEAHQLEQCERADEIKAVGY